MTKENKFYKAEEVERKANCLLMDFQQKFGGIKEFPVPAEKIFECHLNLIKVWNKIEEKDNEMILAGLAPADRMVVFNEAHRDYFEEHEGLELFTLGHEIGHWDLHVEQGVLQADVLPGFSRPFSMICRNGDQSWDEINANRYAAFLLMPKELLLPLAKEFDLSTWADLYKMKEIVGTTISALTNRLNSLGLVYVAEGKIYKSKAEFAGQKQLI